MKLDIHIRKIKSISELDISLPIDKGLYAITGQNGSGKSTLVTCASSVFFNMRMDDYFGDTELDSSISFELGEGRRNWNKNAANKWTQHSNKKMDIKGFYEGSVIFGNRFKNASYELLMELDRIDAGKLEDAPEFIRKNLGKVLHNNEEFYEKLLFLNNRKDGSAEQDGSSAGESKRFRRGIFYYQKGEKRVSQFHMSTGENLLVSVLHSINDRNNDRANLNKPCVLFLDEIELALHPSSLKRLVTFLKEMSDEYNYAIYFSTHSIELISGISPSNIFFLERHSDGTVEVLNPCYPAYATRILYDHSGYDFVILVEDDLAREIVRRILREQGLLNTRLVHVLPCGGYTNVIDLSREVISSNLIGKTSKLLVILDADIRDKAEQYLKKGERNNVPLNYLPIESLEKYLKTNLYDKVDHALFRLLNDFIFHQVSLSSIIDEYRESLAKEKRNGGKGLDENGKKLFDKIDAELRKRGKSREEIVEMIVDYLTEKRAASLSRVVDFLKNQLK